jgi:hypothetical protein
MSADELLSGIIADMSRRAHRILWFLTLSLSGDELLEPRQISSTTHKRGGNGFYNDTDLAETKEGMTDSYGDASELDNYY